MREAVIENPVINSAFTEPRRHFKFDDDGITSEIVEARRPSAYFIPVAQPKKRGAQLQLGTEWTDDRRRENDYINEVRAKEASAAVNLSETQKDIAALASQIYRDPTTQTRSMLLPTVQLNGDDTVGSGTIVFSGENPTT